MPLNSGYRSEERGQAGWKAPADLGITVDFGAKGSGDFVLRLYKGFGV